VEVKESALVWHYRNADPDLGAWQAKELLDHLEDVLSQQPVEVTGGHAIVEVKPRGVSKGGVVEDVLAAAGGGGGGGASLPGLVGVVGPGQHASDASTSSCEFVLVIGDDRSDEDMFTAVERAAGVLRGSASTIAAAGGGGGAGAAGAAGGAAAAAGGGNAGAPPARNTTTAGGSSSGRIGAGGGGASAAAAGGSDAAQAAAQAANAAAACGRTPAQHQAVAAAAASAARGAEVFACVVGQKPSRAPLYLNDTTDVVGMLARMAGVDVDPTLDGGEGGGGGGGGGADDGDSGGMGVGGAGGAVAAADAAAAGLIGGAESMGGLAGGSSVLMGGDESAVTLPA
jgi:hypothetical protein